MKSLLKFVRLPARDRLLLLKAFVLLGLVRLGLWRLSFKRLQQVLHKISHSPQASPVASIRCSSIHKIVWAVDVSGHLMPGHVKCLARALTAQVLMSRRGYTPDLRIGVAKDQNNCLEAHAWIELEGSVVIGLLPDLKRFVPMPSLGVDLL
ncbi:MAG: lasso peptide biosynthesis B2 protein [Cyanobacteria bacterium P01_A01_bin.17]